MVIIPIQIKYQIGRSKVTQCIQSQMVYEWFDSTREI